MIYLSLITSLLTPISCSPIENQTSQKVYDYSDIVDFSIDFKDIFKQKGGFYFIYFYTKHCLHCELIKQDVISYSLSHLVPMYFVEYENSIKVMEDVSYTIGMTSVENLAILGTPSLLAIKEKAVSLNVAGMDLIKSILKEYN